MQTQHSQTSGCFSLTLPPQNTSLLRNCTWALYESAWVVMIKCHRLGGLNSRHLSSYSFGGWRSKIKVPTGLVSPEASLLGLQTATFSLCPLFACSPAISSSSYKASVLLDQGPTLMTSFNLVTSLKDPSPNTVTFGGGSGGASSFELRERGIQFSP